MTCATCRYFHAPDECRRHAPVMVPMFGKTVFAATDAGAWCGEFTEAPATSGVGDDSLREAARRLRDSLEQKLVDVMNAENK